MSASSAEGRRIRAAAEAAGWVQRLDSDDLSAQERGEFVDWLRESPVHVAEMLRMGRLATALEAFGDWAKIPRSGNLLPDVVIPLPTHRWTRSPAASSRAAHRKWYAGVAAALAPVAVCALLLLHQLSATAVHTQAGERREITLADGSVVRLSPGTDLTIRLEPQVRSVKIMRGEAVFHVAKDRDRPFVVDAAGTRVQAVGTVFSVASNAETVVVTVTEGRVKVTPANAATGNPGREREILLDANERVSLSAQGIARPVRRIEASPTLEWGENQVVFENARVADVVARFNHRNRVQIRIEDDVLAARTVSGVFAVDDPRSFVEFLQAIAGAAGTDNGPDEIVISATRAGASPAASPR